MSTENNVPQGREKVYEAWADLTPEEEADIDHLTDKGFGYAEALKRVTNRDVPSAADSPNGQMHLFEGQINPRKPHPALKPREREVADRRPGLKPPLPVLNGSTRTDLPEVPIPPLQQEQSQQERVDEAYRTVYAFYDEPLPPHLQ